MRIVGGEARGRRLVVPEGMNTRPTADRVRESLMNILARRIPGARVLDLFAGSGALGLEALSRGASFAVLVDMDKGAGRAIRRNIELVRAEDRALFIQADYKSALRRLDAGFDIVFLDPPFDRRDVYADAATRLREMGLLNEGAVLSMEHRSSEPLELPDPFTICDERRYGACSIALVKEGPL